MITGNSLKQGDVFKAWGVTATVGYINHKGMALLSWESEVGYVLRIFSVDTIAEVINLAGMVKQ